MPQIALNLPGLHKNQLKIYQNRKRFNVIVCGRRWGKSTLAKHLLIETALAGKPAAYFTPSYEHVVKFWNNLKDVLRPIIRSVNEQHKLLTLVTGGSIECWSLIVPDACRGNFYARVVLDEVAFADKLEEAWNGSIRPALGDYQGDAWFCSTPNGRNYFFTLYSYGQDTDNPEWISWQMPSTTNPTLPHLRQEIESAKLTTVYRNWRQEWFADFVENEGAVFGDILPCVDKGRTIDLTPPDRNNAYYCGIDIGEDNDYTAISILDESGKQVYFDRFRQIGWERQLARIEEVCKLYNARVVIEKNYQSSLIEFLAKAGVQAEPFATTQGSKQGLIDTLALAFEQKTITLLDNPVQTIELQSYEYKQKQGESPKYGAPNGMHDDSVMSLALSLYCKNCFPPRTWYL